MTHLAYVLEDFKPKLAYVLEDLHPVFAYVLEIMASFITAYQRFTHIDSQPTVLTTF